MEEIKAPLHKRIIYFLYAHLALFGLLILIAVVLFSSCGKAKAADYSANGVPDGQEDWLYEHMMTYHVAAGHITQAQLDDYLSRVNNSEYVMFNYFTNERQFRIRYYTLNDIVDNVTNTDSGCLPNSGIMYLGSFTNHIGQFKAYSLDNTNGTINMWRAIYNGREGTNNTSKGTISYYNTNNYWFGYGSWTSNNNFNWNADFYSSIEGSWACGYVYGGGNYIHNSTYITYTEWTEDNRLKLSTIMDNGRKELAIDFSDFFTEEYASSYQINDLTLTIAYDGTEQEITGLSQYYQAVSTTDKMAFIPYTALGFDTNNEIQYNDVEVINCSFTKSVTYPNRPGTTEDFNILCSYYLKKTTVPIEADTVNLDDTIYEDVVTDTTITDTLNEIGVTSTSNSDGVWSNYTLVQSLPTFPSWCSTITVAIWQSKVWENDGWTYRDEWYFKGDDVDFNTWYHEAYPFDLPYANNYALYYDVLIINLGDGVKQMSVASTPNDFPTNQAWGDYIILYSARYYQHKNVEGLYSLIDAFQKDANQSKENWSYLKERLDDFENKTLEAMTSTTEPTSIFYKLNTLDNDLMNGVTRIVNKIPSPFDDTDILDAISDVTDAISAISFPTTDMSTTNSLLERINAVLGGQDDESTLLETPYALHNLYPLLQLLNGEENKLVVFDTTPPSSPSNDVIYITVNSEWWATTFNSIIGGYLGLKGSIPIDDVSDFFITFYDALYGRTIDTVPDYAPGDSEKQITNYNRMFSRIYEYDFDPSLYWGEVQIGE